ncbi:PLC-like phosphodiesterase [Amanita rubescens]|nr:PLC-like phosphodiesterase [Amanita rubescens]
MSTSHSGHWLHRLEAHMPHMPHLHHHSHSTASLPISIDHEDQWDLSVPEEMQLTVSMDPDKGRILYKSRVSGIVPIEAIKELRTGAEGSYYREQFSLPPAYDERWISIIYIRDGDYKTVHFVAPTLDVFRLWDTTLRRLHSVRQGLMQGLGNPEVREQLWERMYWKSGDNSGDQKMDVEEVKKLCQELGVHMSKEEIQALFKQADPQGRGYLGYPEFQRFVKIMKRRPEIEQIHAKLCSSNNGVFDFGVFQHLLRDIQKSKQSDEELKSTFERFAKVDPPSSLEIPVGTASGSMTVEQFREFLMSDDNSPFSDQNKAVWQDMTRPYLVGVSTIEGYIRALLHSCRTVEMDIYDGPTGEPVVYHGKTLTSKVSVRDICHAIAKYAFVTSPYPVMISAEIHCNMKQQNKMVDIMREIFGDALIRAPTAGTTLKIDTLPSPENLKGKILVKAKNPIVNDKLSEIQTRRLTETLAAEKAANTSESENSSSETSEGTSEGSIFHSILHRVRKKSRHHLSNSTSAGTTVATGGDSSLAAAPSKEATRTAPVKHKISDALASLLVYTVGVSCHGLGDKSYVTYAPEHMFSLSENAANRLFKSRTFDESTWSDLKGGENTAVAVETSPASHESSTKERGTKTGMWELIKHNQTHLTRIYPKGTRVNSSNYQPHRYWAAGAQLAAINWQTFDLGYMINQSMFQRNGKSGYVLKPAPLRRPDNEELLSRKTEHFLEMTIISAQQLPRPRDKIGQDIVGKTILDPFVEVSLHIPDWSHSPFLPPAVPGVLGETATYSPPTERATAAQATSARTVSVHTRTIRNNGFNPVWNEELCIPFDCVGGPEMQELIFVEAKVCHEGKEVYGEPIGLYCTPLGCFEQGFRHLPLHDSQLSQHLFSTLFVQIRVRDA